ncbi:MAG TPA: DMT family transporter [Actinomycetota bacterium]|nr:DMT family transporter [Actinomycetota bacterium]
MTSSGIHRHEVTGVAFAVLAAVAFGTLAISAKLAYRAGVEALPLLAARFTLSAILLAAYNRARGIKISVDKRRFTRLIFGGGFLYGLEASLFFSALTRAPAAVVGLVFYSYPIWTTLLGFMMRIEPFRWSTIAALVLGGSGVALVFSLPETSLAGPLLAVAAAIMVAIYLIYMQLVLRDVEASVAAMWTTAGSAVAFIAASLVTGQSFPAAAIGPSLSLAFASSIAFVALFQAITRIGSARSSIAAMLEPVTTLILAAIFLGEELGPRILLGGALIVAVLPVLAASGREESGMPAADTL